MEHWTYINDHMIRLRRRENGLTLPICEDVFTAVGLQDICTGVYIETFYNLMEQDPEQAVKFTSYTCDLRSDIVKERLKSYFLIDLGIRLEYTADKYIKREELIISASNIGGVLNTWLPSNEILAMLNKQGFGVGLDSI